MIDVTNPQCFRESLRQLNAYHRSVAGHRGRFVQLFLGLKFFQDQLPSMFSNQRITTDVLQTLLDDLYSKASRPLNDCVLMIFTNRFLARTGLVGHGRKHPQNTWRNNFHLQKGIGCYATAQELASPTFLDQDRAVCRHLQPGPNGGLSGGRCGLQPTGARYRNEDHRKWLQIDTSGNGFAVVDLLNARNFLPYVAPDGNRIPIVPLVVALYHDSLRSLVTSTRRDVDIPDFLHDFNFSVQEAASYFDDDPSRSRNASLIQSYPAISYSRIGEGVGQPRRERALARRKASRRAHLTPTPVLSGTQVPPPAVNTGWEAQQYVIEALRNSGWSDVYDVSRQQVGYDLIAKRRQLVRYIDVKSSVGSCSPTLTAREWQQASVHGPRYVLAIIDHFNPTGQNTVFWVVDPYRTCQARFSRSVQFRIAQADWRTVTVSLEQI